jgi:hypothetical protein
VSGEVNQVKVCQYHQQESQTRFSNWLANSFVIFFTASANNELMDAALEDWEQHYMELMGLWSYIVFSEVHRWSCSCACIALSSTVAAVAQLTSKCSSESLSVPILDNTEEATVNDTMHAAISCQTRA